MDEFEKWSLTSTEALTLRGAWEAGREAGMREAAGLCQSHEPKDFTTAGIITRAKCAEVILSAIGGGK